MSNDDKMKELGIKSLEEILAETDASFLDVPEVEEEENEDQLPLTIEEKEAIEDSKSALMKRAEMTNTKHSGDMARVFDTAMNIAEKLGDMGMNIDPTKAPRMFEVMGQHLKIAADASNSERDAQLKLMQIIQNQEKLELDRMRLQHELGDGGEIKGEIVMIEDRNKILAQLKSKK